MLTLSTSRSARCRKARADFLCAGDANREYTKAWLTLEGQVDRLIGRGLDVEDQNRAITTLESIGYYRLTGYLYPYLESEQYTDDEGREQTRVLNRYRSGTALSHAAAIIDFDRETAAAGLGGR